MSDQPEYETIRQTGGQEADEAPEEVPPAYESIRTPGGDDEGESFETDEGDEDG